MEANPFGWWSVLPPVLAVGLAIVTRQVVLSLFAGIWIGWVVYAGGDLLVGTAAAIQCLIDVFAEQIFSAPRAYKRRRKEIDAACQEIATMWPTIDMPIGWQPDRTKQKKKVA